MVNNWNINDFPDASSWETVSCGSTRQWGYKKISCCFGSGSIGFLTEASHKFYSWTSILELEVKYLLFESKKKLSRHSWHRVQHSPCEGVTTAKVCMDHHHYLSNHNKLPDSLARSLADVIYPVLRFHVYMLKTPVAFITWKYPSILVATDWGEAIHPNGILTYIYPTSFCIWKSVFHLP